MFIHTKRMITEQMFLFYKYPFVRQILQHHVLFADDSCVYDTREKYTDVNCINRFFASADRLNLFFFSDTDLGPSTR